MKPNARFAKLDFDDSMIMAQLKCNGARSPLSLLLWWWCRRRRLRLWRDVLLLWRSDARGGATDARRLPESRAV